MVASDHYRIQYFAGNFPLVLLVTGMRWHLRVSHQQHLPLGEQSMQTFAIDHYDRLF